MRVQIQSPADERLGDYVRLRESKLSQEFEAKAGAFIAEGVLVICRAAAAGYRPRSFLLAERWLAELGYLLALWPDVPVYVTDTKMTEQITGFHVHRGALASFERGVQPRLAELVGFERILVCADLVDHANLGAIIRSAAGLGWDAVVVSANSADPLYRRAIKTSMGAVFALPWTRMTCDLAGLEQLRSAGFTLAALELTANACPLKDFQPPRKLALMLGSEGPGLPESWIAQADICLQIPMQAPVASLNVAAAAAVACYSLGGAATRLADTGQSCG